MTTVGDILDLMDTIAPPYMKMSWDNVGLLCGSRSTPVTRVLVALDPFEGVCQEAADTGAQLIVTHHPLIFKPFGALTDERAITRAAMILIRHGISAINAHTNLDCAPGGVNDVLARVLGLSEVQVLDPMGTDASGRPWGLIRTGTVAAQPLQDFLQLVKDRLACPGLRYADGGRPVHRVAVGGGSCASELPAVVRSGCDTFVTSDMRYNDFWDARDQGVTLIDAGHFCTENPVCTYLQQQLRAAFPELTVELSRTHHDCMQYT